MPAFLSYLARAHAELGQFDEAWRCTTEARAAVEATEERLWEAEVNRIAGEIALLSPERDTAKAEASFERALAVARQQQAKSWELRAAMSLARLWREQGKVQQARELLAPVYGWFTRTECPVYYENQCAPNSRRATGTDRLRQPVLSTGRPSPRPRPEVVGSGVRTVQGYL